MPELPEVETVVRQLQKKIIGKKISSVNIFDLKVASPGIQQAKSATIMDVVRRGKSIIVPLSSGLYLLFHLRMTGHFSLGDNLKDYAAVTFCLSKPSKHSKSSKHSQKESLTFHSIRRFSRVELVSSHDLDKKMSALGPDPFDVFPEDFAVSAKKYPHAILKNKLLDQTFLAGVGNIYAQEALYHAGIHPQKKIGAISKPQLEQAHREMQRVLQLSMANNGTTVYNYSHIDGKGDFQHLLAVYGREKCPQGHPIKRAVIGGRGTYYCSKCQR